MIEKLRKRPLFANCATDEDVLKRIDEIETEAAKVPGLEKENGDLKTATEERRVADEAVAEAEVDAELDEAVKVNRIAEPEKAEFKAMFKAAPDTYRAQLDRRKPGARIVDLLGDDESGKKGAWDSRMEEIDKDNANK